MVLLLVALVVLASPTPLDAGGPLYPVASDAGPAVSTVTAVARGPQGFLWIGTPRGLLRFDGHELLVARDADGAALAAPVTAIYRDDTTRLLVGTREGTVYSYDTATRRFVPALGSDDPTDADSEAADLIGPPLDAIAAIAAIDVDPDGRLWIATRGSGLLRIDPETATHELLRHDPLRAGTISSANLTAIAIDTHGNAFLGSSDRGVTRHDRVDAADVWRAGIGRADRLPSDSVTALTVDASDTVWVGTADGSVGTLDPADGSYRRVGLVGGAGVPISALETAPTGVGHEATLWVAWRDGTLARLRGDEVRYFAAPAPVLTLRAEPSGIVWIGTLGAGLLCFDERRERFEHPLPSSGGEPNRLVWSLAEGPDGSIWIATDGGGVKRLDPGTGEVVTVLGAPPAFDIHVSPPPGRAGDTTPGATTIDLALGSAGHASLSADRDGTAFGVRPGASSVHRVDGGLLLGLVAGGLLVAGEGLPARHETGGAVARSIVSGTDGSVWIGTDGPGLFRLDGAGDRREPHRLEPHRLGIAPATGAAVWSIDPRPDGSLWIAAGAAGLARYDPTSATTLRLRPAVDLDADVVYGVVADELGGLWASTNRGIVRIDERSGRIEHYGPADGIAIGEPSAGAILRSRDGSIYVGGVDGLLRFDPGELRRGVSRAPVAVSSVDLPDGGDIVWSGVPRVSLPSGATEVTVTVAALDFADPDSYRYSYLRSGRADWVDAGTERVFVVDDLEPGLHRLHVRATRGAGGPVSGPIAIDVDVAAPSGMRRWLIAAVALALGVSVLVLAGVVERADDRRRKGQRSRFRG